MGRTGREALPGAEDPDLVRALAGADAAFGADFLRSALLPAAAAAAGRDRGRLARPEPAAAAATQGDDVLDGTTGGDSIDGLGGDDVINGLGGDDRLDGGDGNDVINGGDDWDMLLVSGTGTDAVHGGSGSDYLLIDYRDSLSPLSSSASASPAAGTDGFTGSIATLSGDRVVNFDGIERIQLLSGSADDVIQMGGSEDEVRSGDGIDQVFGGGGPDVLNGGAGNDRLGGEAGDDVLIGGAGDDLLEGGIGNDLLIETEGRHDQMLGGEGDDRLAYTGAFSDDIASAVIDGGSGDDDLYYDAFGNADSAQLIGGDGNDRFELRGGGDLAIDAGAGADYVQLIHLATRYAVSLGAGSDLLALRAHVLQPAPGAAIAVSDFAAGDGADALELEQFLVVMLKGWDRTANPFASGHLALVQSGADSVLRIDLDGAGAAHGLADLVVLRNVAASSLTARNLGGWAASGASVAGQTITGSAADEILSGTGSADLIAGLDGDDDLHGASGNDLLEGGAGIDLIDGGLGDDLIYGGFGDDRLVDPLGGSDRLFGESGADSIVVDRQLALGGSTLLIDGGGDFDNISYSGRIFDGVIDHGDVVTLVGGAGNDAINVVRGGRVTIDGGEGADQVAIDVRALSYDISLGGIASDRDILFLVDSFGPVTSFTVHDLTPGAGGDWIRLGQFLDSYAPLWDPATNPFATGFLELAQSGGDALIRIDRDGGGDGFVLLGTLKNVDAAALTQVNLEFAPGAIAISGGAGADSLAGTSGNDRMSGFAGNDVMSGGTGADLMIGGLGGDRLVGGAGADLFIYASAADSTAALRSDGRKLMPDVIADFASGADRIDLSAIDAVAGTPGDDAFAFIGAAAFSGHAGELRFELRDGVALISADLDGNRIADLQIVAHTTILQAADFVL